MKKFLIAVFVVAVLFNVFQGDSKKDAKEKTDEELAAFYAAIAANSNSSSSNSSGYVPVTPTLPSTSSGAYVPSVPGSYYIPPVSGSYYVPPVSGSSSQRTFSCSNPKCVGGKQECTICGGDGILYTETKYSANFGSGSVPYEIEHRCHTCVNGWMDCPYC